MMPIIWAVAIQPITNPSEEPGTCEATSAVAALLKPPVAPMSARVPISCQTLPESPISAVVTAPPMLERMTIARRPYLSASEPHSGAQSAAVRKFVEPMMPAQTSTWESGCTPNCCRYSGMNGREMENAPALMI